MALLVQLARCTLFCHCFLSLAFHCSVWMSVWHKSQTSPSHSLFRLVIAYPSYCILDWIWGFEISLLFVVCNTNRIDLSVMNTVLCCAYDTGESSFEVKIEADSNDITEHPHDNKTRPYLCMVCDKRFTNKSNLNAHRTLHAGEKLYSCTQCDKHFPNKRYLSFHMNVHSSKYSCTECGKCFRGNPELTKHRRIHSGEKPFECTVCSKRFTQSSELVRHSRIHSGEKPHKCHICNKAFSLSVNRNTHISIHMGDKPYKCTLCNRSFSRHNDLQCHSRHAHSNGRSYDSRYCGKLCKSSSHLKCQTSARLYSCKHCSDHFTWHHQLKRHLLKSHNEGALFTCHICQKKFIKSDNFKTHLLRHVGVKPYICLECPKRFCTAYELKQHLLAHSDVRRFCCDFCGKSFKYKKSLVSHFKLCSDKLKFGDI